ncbi:hypothetical protein [Veillonella intestinalis]|uniref:hypothetical protein n=1 Tax=Veillonella intestinalis TaxID=2941341 RepID=UPI00203B0696|nr:hypothetical protein [Veillonella intestinalis]
MLVFLVNTLDLLIKGLRALQIKAIKKKIELLKTQNEWHFITMKRNKQDIDNLEKRLK